MGALDYQAKQTMSKKEKILRRESSELHDIEGLIRASELQVCLPDVMRYTLGLIRDQVLGELENDRRQREKYTQLRQQSEAVCFVDVFIGFADCLLECRASRLPANHI